MALLTRLARPNQSWVFHDAEAQSWIDDFFVSSSSRKGLPVLHPRDRTAATEGRFEWEIRIGANRVAVPKAFSGAAIGALHFAGGEGPTGVVSYESRSPQRSVRAVNAGLPTLGKR